MTRRPLAGARDVAPRRPSVSSCHPVDVVCRVPKRPSPRVHVSRSTLRSTAARRPRAPPRPGLRAGAGGVGRPGARLAELRDLLDRRRRPAHRRDRRRGDHARAVRRQRRAVGACRRGRGGDAGQHAHRVRRRPAGPDGEGDGARGRAEAAARRRQRRRQPPGRRRRGRRPRDDVHRHRDHAVGRWADGAQLYHAGQPAGEQGDGRRRGRGVRGQRGGAAPSRRPADRRDRGGQRGRRPTRVPDAVCTALEVLRAPSQYDKGRTG